MVKMANFMLRVFFMTISNSKNPYEIQQQNGPPLWQPHLWPPLQQTSRPPIPCLPPPRGIPPGIPPGPYPVSCFCECGCVWPVPSVARPDLAKSQGHKLPRNLGNGVLGEQPACGVSSWWMSGPCLRLGDLEEQLAQPD
jgi:hypothetical protein